MLVYFARGSLPWQGLKIAHRKKSEAIKEMKESLPTKELCEELPDEFVTYSDYVRSLKPREKPDYDYLGQLLSRLFDARGFERDQVLDWTVRRYHEMCGPEDAEPPTQEGSKMQG